MLPSGFIFLQRDWLSSNSLLLKQPESAYLFDSGYVTHAQLLVDFLNHQLGDQPLQVLINTHLHSDHCGGNALIQSTYENVQVWVPATQFNAVNAWDEDALSYQITGQLCPRFQATDAVSPNDSLQIHGLSWKVFSSKGHDNDSLIFFSQITAYCCQLTHCGRTACLWCFLSFWAAKDSSTLPLPMI